MMIENQRRTTVACGAVRAHILFKLLELDREKPDVVGFSPNHPPVFTKILLDCTVHTEEK